MSELADERTIRVFISSTFHDFQSERDVLVKRVFPELRRTLNERGLDIVEVDLRWGITAEQSERDEIIPICLAEIDRCRPYFVALLGDRYGWTPPPATLKQILQRHPRLGRLEDVSATELEIRHAMTDGAMRPLVYLRAPGRVRSETPAAAAKLDALKRSIREGGQAVLHEYAELDKFAAKVRADLLAVIERDFPSGQRLQGEALTAAQHAAFARRLANLQTGREPEHQALDQWLGDPKQKPLLLVGAAGVGKSAIVASWCARRAAAGDIVFEHYVGAGPDADRAESILARLLAAVRQVTGAALGATADLAEGFAACFAAASAYCQANTVQWIVALDGLDQMGADADLRFLPGATPPGVRLVATSADDGAGYKERDLWRVLGGLTRTEAAALGEADSELFSLARSAIPATHAWRERRWAELGVGPLSTTHRSALLDAAAARFGKSLSPSQHQRIMAHGLSGNPLFLRTLVDELRVFGDYDRFEVKLDDYLLARTLPNLFARVLERLDADCAPGLAANAFRLLWCSRAGIEEADLVTLLTASPADWSAFVIEAGGLLRIASGRVTIAGAALRSACHARYLSSDPLAERSVRLALTQYFQFDRNAARAAEEVPFQLHAAGAWAQLEAALTDLRWFSAIAARGHVELWGYWLALEQHGRDAERLLTDAWRARRGDRSSPDALALGSELAAFLRFAGAQGEPTLLLHAELVQASRARHGSAGAATLERIKQLGALLLAKGHYDRAEKELRFVHDAQSQALGAGRRETAATGALVARAAIGRLDYGAAQPLLENAVQVLRQASGADDLETLAAMSDLATVESAKGNLKDALRLRRAVMESLQAMLGAAHPATLEARARYLYSRIDRGDLIDAKYEARAVLEARERVLGMKHPLTLDSAVALALILIRLDDRDARRLLEFACEELQRTLGVAHASTLRSLQRLAERLALHREWTQATPLLVRLVETRSQALGAEHPETLESVGALAKALFEQGRIGDALTQQRRFAKGLAAQLGEKHPVTLDALATLRTMEKSRTVH